MNNTGTVLLFDGLTLIQTFDLNIIDNKIVLEAYDSYLKKLKKMQDEFFKGDTPEDEIIDKFEKELKQELDKQLKKLFVVIGKSGKKTEAFLSGTILAKVDGFFKDFGKRLFLRFFKVDDIFLNCASKALFLILCKSRKALKF